jgi:hypothetical protein
MHFKSVKELNKSLKTQSKKDYLTGIEAQIRPIIYITLFI